MRLAERTDFGLRALMLLAAGRDRRTVSAMAQTLDVSANHLTKVVQALQAQAWVATTAGRLGGAELIADPKDLTVGAVVRALEPDLALVECLRDDGSCPLQGPCRLADALRSAREAFLSELDRISISDLVRGRRTHFLQLGVVV